MFPSRINGVKVGKKIAPVGNSQHGTDINNKTLYIIFALTRQLLELFAETIALLLKANSIVEGSGLHLFDAVIRSSNE